MSDDSDQKKPGRPRKIEEVPDREPDKMYRTAVYMSGELLDTIAEQARAESSNLSKLNSEIMSTVLLSPAGKKLREAALKQNRPLATELSQLLETVLSSSIGGELEQELENVAKSQFQTSAQVVAGLIATILAPPIGDKLIELARKNHRTLTQELEQNLLLFKDHVNFEEIVQLSEATLRTPDEMLTRLALLGLEVYKQRNLANTD